MGYICTSCGEFHAERLTSWKFDVPAVVSELSEDEIERRVELGSEVCVLDGKHFFILGNLDVPIKGSDEFLRWTVWGTLSEANFNRANELWEREGENQSLPISAG